MAETISKVQGSTIEGVRDHPLDTMQIMGIEDSFPAIDLTSLGDLPGILSSINENQPTLPSLKQTATSTEITKRQNQDLPTGILIQEQSHTGDTPNIPVEEMQPPGPSTQVQPTENPPPDPIEQYLRSVASIVPSERVEPPPLTPLQQELSELTLLPLNRRPRQSNERPPGNHCERSPTRIITSVLRNLERSRLIEFYQQFHPSAPFSWRSCERCLWRSSADSDMR